MDLLDLAIIVVAVLAAMNGYRRGAALQLTTYAGLMVGLLAGAVIAPKVAAVASSPVSRSAFALIALIAFAAIGDAIGAMIGSRIWVAARRSALGGVDSAAGSVVAIIAVLLAVWFLGWNLANGPFQGLSEQIRGSAIVRGLDDQFPRPPSLLAEVRQFLNRFGFPEVFADLPPAPAGPVQGPTKGRVAAIGRLADGSTVQIVGKACTAIQEGSGFVAADHYVITNAHVVAGVKAPTVQEQNGPSQPGTVVLFDPKLDIAIIRVGDTPGPVLALDPHDVDRGTQGAVIGYPGGGPLTNGGAAVRRDLPALGRDIYGKSVVERDVYELQAIVRPGNSGGPFVLSNGTVAGVVFAASTTDTDVGYALTTPQILPLLKKADGRTEAVSTDGCSR